MSRTRWNLLQSIKQYVIDRNYDQVMQALSSLQLYDEVVVDDEMVAVDQLDVLDK